MLHVILRTPHSLHLEDNSEQQPQLEPMQLSTTVTAPSSVAKPCGVEGEKKACGKTFKAKCPHCTSQLSEPVRHNSEELQICGQILGLKPASTTS